MDQLKPCPNPTCNFKYFEIFNDSYGTFQIICCRTDDGVIGCGYHGPRASSPEEAFRLHNNMPRTPNKKFLPAEPTGTNNNGRRELSEEEAEELHNFGHRTVREKIAKERETALDKARMLDSQQYLLDLGLAIHEYIVCMRTDLKLELSGNDDPHLRKNSDDALKRSLGKMLKEFSTLDTRVRYCVHALKPFRRMK